VYRFHTDTTAAVFRAFEYGMPMIRRIVTVSGSALANPKNLHVPIGTPLITSLKLPGALRTNPTN
jgi:electron transport complex protein RnfC